MFDAARSEFDLEAGYNMGDDLVTAVRQRPIRFGETLVGECAERREAVRIEDLSKAPPQPLFAMHMKAGMRALLGVPLLHRDAVVGALVVRRERAGAFAPETIGLLQSFAAQSAIAIQNARLFHEIAHKSHQLELASQHKSQFVASMSHELRTPLNAVIGPTEMMVANAARFGTEKAQEPLRRVHAAGTHLLGLINQVLDLSKIEAGKLELNPEKLHLAPLVDEVIGTARQLAEQNKNRLAAECQDNLAPITVDPMRLRQILLNLLSNACKFTKQGEVALRVRKVADGRTGSSSPSPIPASA